MSVLLTEVVPASGPRQPVNRPRQEKQLTWREAAEWLCKLEELSQRQQSKPLVEQETVNSIRKEWFDSRSNMLTLMRSIIDALDEKRPLGMKQEGDLRKIFQWLEEGERLTPAEMEQRALSRACFDDTPQSRSSYRPILEKRTGRTNERAKLIEDARERLKRLPTDREELTRALFS